MVILIYRQTIDSLYLLNKKNKKSEENLPTMTTFLGCFYILNDSLIQILGLFSIDLAGNT